MNYSPVLWNPDIYIYHHVYYSGGITSGNIHRNVFVDVIIIYNLSHYFIELYVIFIEHRSNILKDDEKWQKNEDGWLQEIL